LRVPQEIISQYIIDNGYEKPKIEINNYYLQWNENCFGISSKEIVELKEFITNVIPSFDAVYKLINSVERPKSKKRFVFNNKLSPAIHFSHRNKANLVSYDLYMMSDGATFIDRIEKIEIISKDGTLLLTEVNIAKDNFGKLELYLKSKLGQLLFIRQSRG
jgi:hypothetical protein